MNNETLMFIEPETLKEVEVEKLLETPYKERCEKIFINTTTKKKDNTAEIPKEKVVRNTTEEGFKLDKSERTKEGGALGKLERLKTFNPKKPWLHQYGQQLCQTVKPNSHIFGKPKMVRYYTESFHKVHATKKFENVRDIIASIGTVRKQYIKDMSPAMAKKDFQKFLMATMLCMSDESAFRIGSKEDCMRKINKIYGITTLLAKHFSECTDKNGNTYYKITFNGKDSVKNNKIIKNKDSVRNLQYILRDKKPNEFVFTVNNHLISNQELNEYLKDISGNPNFSFHKFRHKKATEIFEEEIKKAKERGLIPDMPTIKEVRNVVDNAITKASEVLCNTPGACRKSYVVPQCVFDVFKEYDLPIPEVYKQNVYDKDELKEMGVDMREIFEEDDVEENIEEDDSTTTVKSYSDNIYGEAEEDDDFFDVSEDDLEDDEKLSDEENDIIDDEEDLTLDGVTQVDDDSDPFEFDNDEDYYEADFDFMEEFEGKMLEYEHDESQIFVNPDKVTSAYLVEKDFEPDFTQTEEHMQTREDFYDRNKNKSTELDVREESDVDKWGYNDYPMDAKKIKEEMENRARRDIDRILKDAKND